MTGFTSNVPEESEERTQLGIKTDTDNKWLYFR